MPIETLIIPRPDYKKVKASGKMGFNDKASAARWYLPKDKFYRLYDNANYGGRTYDLDGTGSLVECTKLEGFNDKTSSSKYLDESEKL
ncbi:MAG: hypothetical protein AAGD38_22660 [Acidobacteriota bacterium]